MTTPPIQIHFLDALKIRDIRYFVGSVSLFTLGSRALAVVIGFQIYQITHSALALGWLGLVEAIPAISLVLFGGYVADHFNRRSILLITRGASLLCAVALILLSLRSHSLQLAGLYTVIFLAGIARGFTDPATIAFEAQIVPKHLTVNASAWISSAWITASVVGPAAIGFIFAAWNAEGSYIAIAICFLLSCLFTLAVGNKELPKQTHGLPMLKSVGMGWKFIRGNQPLFASMFLDLFGVLFGGAIALLPIYAEDILHVGPKGLGLLNAAPSAGAIIMTLIGTRHPPIKNAGRNLLLAVLGFGISILLFAFSRNFVLSLVFLFFSGVFDGVSMIIRRSMIRLLSPDELRGRVAAVNSIFICASNELGALESGMVAALIGTVPCVAAGGILTMIVTALVAWKAKDLLHLSFDKHSMEVIPRNKPSEQAARPATV